MMNMVPYPAPPPSTRRHPARYALAFLTVLAVAALIILLISPDKPTGSAIDRRGGTRVTLTGHSFDGSPPAPEALSQAQHVIRSRLTGLGFTHPQIDATGDTLTVTVPGNNADAIRDLGQAGHLYIRPVIHSLPAALLPPGLHGRAGAPTRPDSPQDLARRIAEEKKLRQGTSVALQLLALQFQATRCDRPDILADNDDPDLPLVTCSADHKAVYVLAPSIISGDQIQDASSSFDHQSRRYVVNLQLTGAATKTWAQYTGAHIGTQTAFTMDSQVISAPQIGQAMRDGKIQIAGGGTDFTADSAGRLANVLKYGSLPMSFTKSESETVAPKSVSAHRPMWPVLTTAGLLVALLCLQAYLYRARIRRSVSPRR